MKRKLDPALKARKGFFLKVVSVCTDQQNLGECSLKTEFRSPFSTSDPWVSLKKEYMGKIIPNYLKLLLLLGKPWLLAAKKRLSNFLRKK